MITLEESMAIAVLRGDTGGARALADRLSETINEVQVLPMVEITCPVERIRVALIARDNTDIEPDNRTELNAAIIEWLRNPKKPVLPLMGVERIELYQLPESEPEKLAGGDLVTISQLTTRLQAAEHILLRLTRCTQGEVPPSVIQDAHKHMQARRPGEL